MHGNRRSVKFDRGGGRVATRALVPLLALAALAASPAGRAELVAPGVDDGALAVARDGSPRVAWLDGRRLVVASRRDGVWRRKRVAIVPDAAARVAGLEPAAALVESRRGAWLRLVLRAGTRWRVLRVADAPRRGRLGAAGLALDARGRPAVAYAVWAGGATTLFLARVDPRGRLSRTRITRRGFPRSVAPPAAAPVLWPDGSLRIVQTFAQRGANAILWRRERQRWWGRVLHASALGRAELPVHATATAAGVFAAWTISYTSGENHLVLSTQLGRSGSSVLHPNAFAAALAIGPSGAEVAANEPLVLDGRVAAWAGLVMGAATSELDGRVRGYEAASASERQLLLARPDGLEWFRLPAPPAVRVTLDVGFRGRVEGASGGIVQIYEERPELPRRLVAEAALDEDGAFAATVAPAAGAVYRAVFVDPSTGVPYARLLRP